MKRIKKMLDDDDYAVEGMSAASTIQVHHCYSAMVSDFRVLSLRIFLLGGVTLMGFLTFAPLSTMARDYLL